ncbi:hypothetical protein ACNQGP_11330 [Flavobacterium sp. GT2N3]|uniref:hypothetical protein n=1 Tax=unclassified Flavobacterium TaxID=196869 RepID=UPI003AAA7001
MNIISHRGYWKAEEEKNKLISFDRSFKLGFGTETDVRDYRGELVISHDIPDENSMSLDVFFKLYNTNCNSALTLALNIKSDGLQLKLKNKLLEFGIENYFVFDMSIPDTLGYLKNNITTFSRHSEYEPIPAFFSESKGIWLDAFGSIWFDDKIILDHIKKGKKVAIVSPELHKRNPIEFWEYLKINKLHQSEDIILCTDIPEDAIEFFNN